MSLVPPTTPIVPAISGFPWDNTPYSNVAPLTYRDAATMQWEVEKIKEWIRDTLVPHTDGEFVKLVEAWAENVTSLIAQLNEALTTQASDVNDALTEQQTEVNAALTEQQTTVNAALDAQVTAITNQLSAQNAAITAQLAAQDADVASSVAAMTTYVDDAVASIINSTIAVTDPVVIALTDNPATEVAKMLDFVTVRGLLTGSANAAANTALIQSYLDSGRYKRVYIPSGTWYITALNLPANVELTGDYSRDYVAIPTRGTVLRNNDGAQTTAIITTNLRSKLSNIAIIGAGDTTANAPGVRVAANGLVITHCAIGYCHTGIDGNYKLLIADNVHIYNNRNHGIRDTVDSMVQFCTINANRGDGVYHGTGADSGHYIGNRIEWNNGHGFNFFEVTATVIQGNFIDRNGKVGIRMASCGRVTVQGNTIRRNGRLSSATANDDANIYLQSNDGCLFTGNATSIGQDDGGGGYISPRYAVKAQTNTNCVMIGNRLSGGTEASYDASGGADTNMKKHSNIVLNDTPETAVGFRNRIATVAKDIPGTTTETFVFTLAPQATNSRPIIYDADFTIRVPSTGASRSAVAKIIVSRPATADAGVNIYQLTNLQGTDFGTSATNYIASVAVSADGTTLTVSIQNTTGSTVSTAVALR
jgi:hypothetical protein